MALKKDSFGTLLKNYRLAAGLKSLSAAVTALQRRKRERVISKAMLSLLERDEVDSANPETLRDLAALYKVSYAGLATKWFCERFSLSLDNVVATHTFIKKVDEDTASLLSPSETGDSIEIVSLKHLEQLQAALPPRSKVYVAAVRFLDDGPYYSMVTKNLSRGISYSYLLPEEGYPIYRAFLSRVEGEFPKLRGKLDGKLTKYLSRVNIEAPINYVVFELPDQSVQGYVGLLLNDSVQYYQAADPRLSWRLFQGFRWSAAVAGDPQLRRRLSELGAEFVNIRAISPET